MSDRIQVMAGDCRNSVAAIANNCVDSCVTDGPYALVSITERFGAEGAAPAIAREGGSGVYARASAGFMGQKWDTGETYFDPKFWRDVFRVLKPGAHVLAFAGTRTYHRLACAIEDAGFEIRDQIGWAYGSGFPKSHNQDGDWDGYGTALKPAWEPICLARKPPVGTIADNLRLWGTSALNIDGCRVGYASQEDQAAAAAAQRLGQDSPGRGRFTSERNKGFQDPAGSLKSFFAKQDFGRWPANIIHDGSDEVAAAFPSEASHDVSAARFFYTAKADADDRLGSNHPTVKPIDLMRYLVRLITPRGGMVIDPFAGSGTTGIAALAEGCNAILCEREDSYVADIRARIARAAGEGEHSGSLKARRKPPATDAGPLFAAG